MSRNWRVAMPPDVLSALVIPSGNPGWSTLATCRAILVRSVPPVWMFLGRWARMQAVGVRSSTWKAYPRWVSGR